MEINSQSVKAICVGVHILHDKIEVLKYSVQAASDLFKDVLEAGMTSEEWKQAQSYDSFISQRLQAIHEKNIRKWKLKSEMDFHLKYLIQIKQLKVRK